MGKTFKYEIDTKGNVSVHLIEIEGYFHEKEQIENGQDPENPNIYKGTIENVYVIDEYLRMSFVAFGKEYSNWTVTIKNNDRSLTKKPIEFRVSSNGSCVRPKKIKWR